MKIELIQETTETAHGPLVKYWVEKGGTYVDGSDTLDKDLVISNYNEIKKNNSSIGRIVLKSEDI